MQVHDRSVSAEVTGRGAQPNDEIVWRPTEFGRQRNQSDNDRFNVTSHQLEARKDEVAFTLDREKLPTFPQPGHQIKLAFRHVEGLQDLMGSK